MPITAEQLAALSPFTKVQKKTEGKTVVDLLKVAEALVAATATLVNGEGEPTEKVDAYGERIDEIEAVLEKAVEDEDGNVYLEDATDEVAKAVEEFSPDEGSDDDEGAGGGSVTKVSKSAGAAEDVVLSKGLSDDEIEAELEDGEWPTDMSPKDAPIMRNARLTKGERPVPARPGARGRVKKRYADARDEAFGRGGDSGRCMT